MELDAETAVWLKEVAERHELDWHPAYSGRGMYGAQCVGVSGHTLSHLLSFMFEVCVAGEESIACWMAESVSSDDFGRGLIWYWPKLQVASEEV